MSIGYDHGNDAANPGPRYISDDDARKAVFLLFLSMDSENDDAGISAAEFRELFAMCRCRRVFTRRVFEHHKERCPTIAAARVQANIESDVETDHDDDHIPSSRPTFIDLTSDSDDGN
jgi:hypothetical protein